MRAAPPAAATQAPVAYPAAFAGSSHDRRAPRLAVISAFEPEWTALLEALEAPTEHVINGTCFLTGRIAGRDVVLFLCGVSMVNAAMTTQLALSRFPISGIVLSGIAGSAHPEVEIGDVIVPSAWGQYLETIFARSTPEGFALPPGMGSDFPNHGMIFVRHVEMVCPVRQVVENRFWFPADPGFLDLVAQLDAPLAPAPRGVNGYARDVPRLLVGGKGVSGPAFVDNAEVRAWIYRSFEASIIDMETAAIAHVAHANRVPFIAFSGVSDRAGGGEGENEMRSYLSLAARNSAEAAKAFIAALTEAEALPSEAAS